MSLQHGILGFLNYGSCSGYELTKAFMCIAWAKSCIQKLEEMV